MFVLKTKRVSPIEKIARDVWDRIAENLSSLSIRHANQALRINSYTSQEKHGAVWDVIFQDSTWIAQAIARNSNPILIGYRIDELYRHGDRSNFDNMFMTLIDGHIDEEEVSKKDQELFFDCLQSHTFDRETNEVVFRFEVILNVESTIIGRSTITMQSIQLFRQNYKGNSRTFCVYAHDDKSELQKINDDKIASRVDISRLNCETLINHKCALTLKPLNKKAKQ